MQIEIPDELIAELMTALDDDQEAIFAMKLEELDKHPEVAEKAALYCLEKYLDRIYASAEESTVVSEAQLPIDPTLDELLLDPIRYDDYLLNCKQEDVLHEYCHETD